MEEASTKKANNAKKKRIKRQNETKEEGDIRRAKEAERKRKKRANETEDEKKTDY